MLKYREILFFFSRFRYLKKKKKREYFSLTLWIKFFISKHSSFCVSVLSPLIHIFTRSRCRICLNLLVCKLFSAFNNTCYLATCNFFWSALFFEMWEAAIAECAGCWHARQCCSDVLFYLLYFFTIANISLDLLKLPLRNWADIFLEQSIRISYL